MSNYKTQRIYVRFRGRVVGPFTLDKAIEMARRGQITRQHELSPDGQNWRPGEEFVEIFPKRAVDAAEGGSAGPIDSKPEAVEQWFVEINKEQVGPVDENKIKQWIAIGTVNRESQVWKEGMKDWMLAELVNPSWFTASVRNPAVTKAAAQVSAEADPASYELMRFSVWILFSGIMTTILGAVQGVAGFALLLTVIASSSAKSGNFIELLLLQLFWMVSGFALLFAGILLLRYSAAVGALRYQPSKERIQVALIRLSSLWLYTGIALLVWVCCFTFLFFLFFLKGIKLSDLLG